LSGLKITSADDAFKASKSILNKKGINEGIAVTLGNKGVVWQSKKNLDCFFHAKPIKVTVVDTAV
jgi:sugar/nucleoside kinase (ribokinase family)